MLYKSHLIMEFLVIKERLLGFLLAIPFLNQMLELVISLFVRKQGLAASIRNLKLHLFHKSTINKKNFSNSLNFHWLIQISAPSGEESKKWGDTYFANELAGSLRNLDQEVKVIYRDEDPLLFVKANTILLNLRGILPLPTFPNALNMIWIISHPNQLTKYELKKYELVFAASEIWAAEKSKKWKMEIKPLLQATNPKKFNTEVSKAAVYDRFLFVGNTRGTFRKSVKALSQSTKDFSVIGKGWEKFLSNKNILKEFIENSELSAEYRKSKYVLSDHWNDMAKNGFIANRIFDAVASGARVISDYVPGSRKIFGKSLVEFKSPKELSKIFNEDLQSMFGTQSELDENAKIIQNQHNFDQRAEVLLNSARNFISQLP